MNQEEELSVLVERWTAGEEGALERLVELLYDDLRALAHQHLRTERADHTLNTTALVHEVYVELARRSGAEWRGSRRLYALASRIMRHLLIDHARRRRAQKRGGDRILVPLDDSDPGVAAEFVDLLLMEDALSRLEAQDERLARIVEYRFYGGLTENEIADVLGITERTVRRDWSLARARLYQLLGPSGLAPEPA